MNFTSRPTYSWAQINATLLEFSNRSARPATFTSRRRVAPSTHSGFIESRRHLRFARQARLATHRLRARSNSNDADGRTIPAPYLDSTGPRCRSRTTRIVSMSSPSLQPTDLSCPEDRFFQSKNSQASPIIRRTRRRDDSAAGPTPFWSVQFQLRFRSARRHVHPAGPTARCRSPSTACSSRRRSIPSCCATATRLVHTVGAPFIRGDCDRSGTLAIGDAIEVLQHLFSGLAILCRDACDSNGSETLDIADAMFELTYLFLLGAAPPPPFPNCIVVPSALGCDSYDCP